MELKHFFGILGKRKWLLLLLFLLAAGTTFFIVSKLPKVYKAGTTISTGIVDYKGKLSRENLFIQQFEIESKFSNLIEYIKSRPSINLMTRELLLHDLTNTTNEKPFRKPKEKKDGATASEIKDYANRLQLNAAELYNPNSLLLNDAVARKVQSSFEYDYSSLIENIDVKRMGETDYIRIEFKSEDPKLTFYGLNQFINELIKYYYKGESSQSDNSVKFYTELLADKKRNLDSLTRQLNSYRQNKSIVNLESEGKAIVSQLQDLEIARENEKKRIEGLKYSVGNLEKNINTYNKGHNNKNYADNVFARSDIREMNEMINRLNNDYINGGMKDEKIKRRIEELKAKRDSAVKSYAVLPVKVEDPMDQQTNKWIADRVNAENELAIASNSVESIDQAINKLKNKKGTLVDANKYVGNLELEQQLAMQDYQNAFNQLNTAKLKEEGSENPLRIYEPPLMPDKPESSNKMMLSLFAGIAAITLASIIFFLMAYFDNTLNSPFQFKKYAHLPLLGAINKVSEKKLDFQELFNTNGVDKETAYFKETLRKIRHEIENSNGKVFLFTSHKDQEGKSFMIVSLAYSLGLKNKKVLIIDTNFKNNTLTTLANTGSALTNSTGSNTATGTKLNFITKLPNVDIIGNKSGKKSPSEMLSHTDFKQHLIEFGKQYDYIFLEGASLNKYSDTRELMDYVDKVIPIFDASSSLSKSADGESLEYLQSLNGKMLGAILNRVDIKNLN